MRSFTSEGLIGRFREVIEGSPDFRHGNNLRYPLFNGIGGAFSVFFMQCPSFLAFQTLMQQATGKNNAASLFRLSEIPSDDQIRNICDEIDHHVLFPVFTFCFEGLVQTGLLDTFRVGGDLVKKGYVLIPLDGTEYFSSSNISCSQCTKKEHANGSVTYSHGMVTPVIVSPNTKHVIPLEPEHIVPQDGAVKQDCESTAAKRWISNHTEYATYTAILLGDDLYSREPMCRHSRAHGFHFIFACKKESHQYLYEWIATLQKSNDLSSITTTQWNGRYHEVITYRWAGDVPIKDGEEALQVSWCEVTIRREEDGKQMYHNAFVTDLSVSEGTVVDICSWGRCRWKVENENNNTLKTKGYHFEHNYGHGKKHLSAVLSTLILLAFLFHTMLDMADGAYQSLRKALGARQTFFDDLRALTRYIWFKDWQHLFIFMEQGLKQKHILPLSPG